MRHVMAAPISIIMTVYNREQYLSAAIESILAQTRGDFELIIWDDASTDRSLKIAQHHAQRDPRIQVVAAEHRGHLSALKALSALASGIYIGTVDSDDLLDPGTLEETARILDQHPQIGMVYTDHWVIDTNGDKKGYGRFCRIPYSRFLLLRFFMTFHFRLIRRSVFDRVGGFDDSVGYAEDWDLCLKLSEITRVWHLRKPLYYYRIHSHNLPWDKKLRDGQRVVKQALKRRGLVNHFKMPPSFNYA